MKKDKKNDFVEIFAGSSIDAEIAHNYWQGKDSGMVDDKILYEGRIKIIEEIT